MDEPAPGTKWQRELQSENSRWGVKMIVIQTLTLGPQIQQVTIAPRLETDSDAPESVKTAATMHMEDGGITADAIRALPWEGLIESTLAEDPPPDMRSI